MFKHLINYSSSSFFILICLFVLSYQTVNGGAWPQKKGKGYYKLDFRYLSGKKMYNSTGDKIPIPTFKDITVGAYGSYGITANLTLFMNASLFKSTSLDSASTRVGSDAEVSGFGDIDLGIKYGLFKIGKTVFSANLILGVPTGKSSPDGGLLLGDGEFNQSIGIGIGHSFWPAPIYVTGGMAFNNRTKGFSDEFKYGIESGYNITKSLSIIVRLHGLISLKNGDSNIKGGFGIFSNNQEYIAYNAELVYKVTNNWGLKGYYESGTNGKNIISAAVLNFGLIYTL